MSGPGVLHETRVAVLRDLADLSGYVVDTQLAANRRPDVVRLHHMAPGLLVADAKATESPGNIETRTRLMGYLVAVRPWLAVGFDVRLAICHGPDPECRWADSVGRLVAVLRSVVVKLDVRAIDHDTWISSVTVVGPE